jgi:uncharacterized protein (TIGR02246 family)
MPRLSRTLFACLILLGAAIPAHAEDLTQAKLQQIATDLAHQYDANYAAKNPTGMIQVYAPDAILVSPSGKILRGSAELKRYYVARFASGAKSHATTITEVHLQGDGGYGIGTFAVTVAEPGGGGERREAGHLVTIYRHYPDGWHLALVIPSTLPGK